MDGWKTFLFEGGQYLRASRGKNGKPSKLANDIQYNLLALSLEKSIMAIHMVHNDLIDNHTFGDLINSVKAYIDVSPALRNEALDLEKTQTICNVFEYSREMPSDQVVVRLAGVAQYLFEQASRLVETLTAPVA